MFVLMLMIGRAAAQEGGPPPTVLEAKEEHATGVTFDRPATGFGLGIILGIPTGFSAAYRPGGRAYYDAALAWSFDQGTLHVHGDVLLTIVELETEEIPGVKFPLYVGVGPRLRIGDSPYTAYTELIDLGVRVPIGMSFIHEDVPLEAFLEVAPGIGLYPATRAIFDVAIGARFYLP